MHFNTIDRNESPLTISGKVAVGVARDSQKFSGHPYMGEHHAVIFAIARLSCMYCRVSIIKKHTKLLQGQQKHQCHQLYGAHIQFHSPSSQCDS